MKEVIKSILRELTPLVIGGYAVQAHGYSRQTLDLDLLLDESDEEALDRVLRGFRYRKEGQNELCAKYLSSAGQIPIDVLFVAGDTFTKLAADSVEAVLFDVRVQTPGLLGLIALKLHAIKNDALRELKDLNDIHELIRANPDKLSADDLEETCRRFGPADIFSKLPRPEK
ncbi:MAG: hypothetical protein ACI8UO_001372 [Verrucomicrobiales bacterium]|jgi:hypothetical protein